MILPICLLQQLFHGIEQAFIILCAIPMDMLISSGLVFL